MEIVPNLRPIVFWLKVRTRGPQPSICVLLFSQFTRSAHAVALPITCVPLDEELAHPFTISPCNGYAAVTDE
jgi:hypothetical protein